MRWSCSAPRLGSPPPADPVHCSTCLASRWDSRQPLQLARRPSPIPSPVLPPRRPTPQPTWHPTRQRSARRPSRRCLGAGPTPERATRTPASGTPFEPPSPPPAFLCLADFVVPLLSVAHPPSCPSPPSDGIDSFRAASFCLREPGPGHGPDR
ncbi:hypothetical protein C8J57DRAFT_153311 [Mycena rebaudengoi]|nr:hypothetical protein C8J57DRAFT_153311 [Mycena rebaudengoi]